MTTYFAPAGRDAPDELRRKSNVVAQTPWLTRTLNAMPSMAMILNGNRQIVAANEALLAVLNASVAAVAEKRPGEAVGCIRAQEGPDGCGTSRHCVTCGAVNAILDSQKEEKKVVRECRILADSPNGITAMDLKVTASPIRIDSDSFIVVAVEDISQAKRLTVLQRTFFHDVLNIAGCIQGYARYVLKGEGASSAAVCDNLAQMADQLIGEIQAQRDLIYAELGDFQPRPMPVLVSQVFQEIRVQYQKHSVAEDRSIVLGTVWDGTVIADRRLLARVLGNMVKNALEATASGGTVTLACTEQGDEVTFAVHNAEVMADEVQLQIFQRSFSTKERHGRGIGTYSMKLFGERYLGGKVEFTSRSPEGTTFTLTIPKQAAGES